jgi:hypothetical protein
MAAASDFRLALRDSPLGGRVSRIADRPSRCDDSARTALEDSAAFTSAAEWSPVICAAESAATVAVVAAAGTGDELAVLGDAAASVTAWRVRPSPVASRGLATLIQAGVMGTVEGSPSGAVAWKVLPSLVFET